MLFASEGALRPPLIVPHCPTALGGLKGQEQHTLYVVLAPLHHLALPVPPAKWNFPGSLWGLPGGSYTWYRVHICAQSPATSLVHAEALTGNALRPVHFLQNNWHRRGRSNPLCHSSSFSDGVEAWKGTFMSNNIVIWHLHANDDVVDHGSAFFALPHWRWEGEEGGRAIGRWLGAGRVLGNSHGRVSVSGVLMLQNRQFFLLE